MDISDSDVTEYYLIRLPKNIDRQELNRLKIDLNNNGPSGPVTRSRSDSSKIIGYDILKPDRTAFNNVTRLDTSDVDNIKLDHNYVLAGCINFYSHQPQPENEIEPLFPTCPNDPIDDIVNRARGYSAKPIKSAEIIVKTEIIDLPHKRKKQKIR
ncbi:hypothetical protein RDWZM_001561 [Blomia tropicalis]|uniref:Uncharacterized protein n=1 Tax=Blomia tropicalis TaxID=40697 RepID=A0A9Q0RRF1_BLOTA|nr:hypothetical protein RDWZM_001561 [Blomia tropicalis]